MITIVLHLFIISCNIKERKDSVSIKLLDIKQEENDRPPPANFDLSAFNIFILIPGSIYYYYQPGFKAEKKFDNFRFEKLDKACLHKTSFKEAEELVSSLKSSDLLKDSTVWLAIEKYDEDLRRKAFEEIIGPSGLSSATVGFITEELYTLLKCIR